jgi:predicted GIY-YIG superfamily endonuclease
VYYEFFDNGQSAFIREKQLKNLSRGEKIELIKRKNPDFKDLYKEILELIPGKPE